MNPRRGTVLTPKPKGLAARAGHWSARHRKTAIVGWLAFIAIVLVAGMALGQKKPDAAKSLDGESRRAQTTLDSAGFPERSGEMVLIQSKTKNDPRLKTAATDVANTVAAQTERRQRRQAADLGRRPLRARPV